MPHNFAFGDQIRNTARPEWGVGTIVRLEPGGKVAVRFEFSGLKQLDPQIAPLASASADDQPSSGGWEPPAAAFFRSEEVALSSSARQKLLIDVMTRLPEDGVPEHLQGCTQHVEGSDKAPVRMQGPASRAPELSTIDEAGEDSETSSDDDESTTANRTDEPAVECIYDNAHHSTTTGKKGARRELPAILTASHSRRRPRLGGRSASR